MVSSSQCATTNAQGAYGISSVAVGSQTVRATAADFEASQQSATVPAGGTVTVDLALTPIPLSEWTNITTEDFAGSFPQPGWHVEDNEPGYGKYYWAKRTCRPKVVATAVGPSAAEQMAAAWPVATIIPTMRSVG